MDVGDADPSYSDGVSVLFSEPKIPQLTTSSSSSMRNSSFSALQRAENSSIRRYAVGDVNAGVVSVLFSEPKIPQSEYGAGRTRNAARFSALQRAENSSISKC